MRDTGAEVPTIASRFVGLNPCARTILGIASSVAVPAMKVRRLIPAPKTLDGMVADQIANAEARKSAPGGSDEVTDEKVLQTLLRSIKTLAEKGLGRTET